MDNQRRIEMTKFVLRVGIFATAVLTACGPKNDPNKVDNLYEAQIQAANSHPVLPTMLPTPGN